jgi:hypothetical protein
MNKLFSLVLAAIMLSTFSARAEDVSSLIFNHRIAIGMTYGNVVASWGKPDKVDRSTRSSGVREYWFYRNHSVMVVFDEGRVSSYSDY